jgi:hypothetical protein
MTRNRVPYRGLGLIAAAVATAMSPNVFPAAGTASLQGAPAGAQGCVYSSIQTLSTGEVTITCNTVVANDPGAIGFSASAYPDVSKDTALATAPFNVSIFRLGGTTGIVTGTVASTTPAVCTVAAGAVTFADGDNSPKTVNVTGLTTGTCSLTFTLGSGSPSAGNLNTSVLIKDAATLPPPPAGCSGLTPTSNFTQFTNFGPAGQGTVLTGTLGVIYSWPLPKGSTGAQATLATITHTQHTSSTSPSEVSVEWSISKCPGDFAYYKTPAASVTSRLKLYAPCGGTFGIESGGLKYNTVGSMDTCKVPTTETWYVNFRFTSGTANCPGGRCDVTYSWF